MFEYVKRLNNSAILYACCSLHLKHFRSLFQHLENIVKKIHITISLRLNIVLLNVLFIDLFFLVGVSREKKQKKTKKQQLPSNTLPTNEPTYIIKVLRKEKEGKMTLSVL